MHLTALLDCNSFFASCEQVFAPRLAAKPVVVLSNNDGCVIARSAEAKNLGIPMGVPFFQVKTLCQREGVAVFSGNFSLYSDMSRRVVACLRQWTPRLEIYSVDEAFMDLTGIPDAETPAFQRNIVRTVTKWTGIPVSLGVAATKTLAKIANHVAKKNGCGFFMFDSPAETHEILKALPVGEVWGVGSRTAKSFLRMGIRTAWDLMNADPLEIRREFSIIQERIVRELRGQQCLEMDMLPAPKQSIQISRSFGEQITTLASLEKPVSTFLVRAAEKLRAQNGLTSAIFLSVIGKWQEPPVNAEENSLAEIAREKSPVGWNSPPRWLNAGNAGTYYSDGLTIPVGFPSDDTRLLLPMTLAALRRIYRPDVAYKKAGITLLAISSRGENQQTLLFDNTPTQDAQRNARLMETLDAIRAKHGQQSIVFGTEELPTKHSWQGRSEQKSPNYTTDWNDLPKVR